MPGGNCYSLVDCYLLWFLDLTTYLDWFYLMLLNFWYLSHLRSTFYSQRDKNQNPIQPEQQAASLSSRYAQSFPLHLALLVNQNCTGVLSISFAVVNSEILESWDCAMLLPITPSSSIYAAWVVPCETRREATSGGDGKHHSVRV